MTIRFTHQFMVYGLWFMVLAILPKTGNYKLKTYNSKGVIDA